MQININIVVTAEDLILVQNFYLQIEAPENMSFKSRLEGRINFFSVDFNPIDTDGFIDVHKYLMKKKKNRKQCLI